MRNTKIFRCFIVGPVNGSRAIIQIKICTEYRDIIPEGKAGLLQWRHNGRDSVSNHQPHDCLLNRLFRCRSKKTSKLRVIGLCVGNSPGTGEFPTQMASYAENVSIWWRHHVCLEPGLRPMGWRFYEPFIGSDYDLSPVRRQSIILINAGMVLIESLGTNLS